MNWLISPRHTFCEAGEADQPAQEFESGRAGRKVLAELTADRRLAFNRTIFAQPSAEEVHAQLARVSEQLQGRLREWPGQDQHRVEPPECRVRHEREAGLG